MVSRCLCGDWALASGVLTTARSLFIRASATSGERSSMKSVIGCVLCVPRRRVGMIWSSRRTILLFGASAMFTGLTAGSIRPCAAMWWTTSFRSLCMAPAIGTGNVSTARVARALFCLRRRSRAKSLYYQIFVSSHAATIFSSDHRGSAPFRSRLGLRRSVIEGIGAEGCTPALERACLRYSGTHA